MTNRVMEAASSGSLSHVGVTVSSVPTLLADFRESRINISIQPLGADIYVGGSGVSTSNGIKITQNALWEDKEYNGKLYAVVASASYSDSRVWEVG